MLPRPSLLLSVFAGGCAGGLARYLVTKAVPGGYRWTTLGINLSGAFLLALLLVLALEVLSPSTYVRPLLGTGFCGAWTTFSGIVVPADELVRDGHPASAAGYLAASLLGGLAAGFAGLVLGRRVMRRTA